MSKVIIIGGVAGGASAAARLRRLDETAQILILERGEHVSYANCGLPYYVGGVIEDRAELLLHTPESLKERYNIDVRTLSEVIAIEPERKVVRVQGPEGEPYEEGYDKLIIATGSSPLRPPIRGIDSPRIRTLWTVGDAEMIHDLAADPALRSVAVIGGGFIGVEMAENLRHRGLDVSLVEMLDQVLTPLDYEMALPLHQRMEAEGIRLHLDDGVDSFHDTGDAVTVTLKSGTEISAQLVILAIGVRPNSELARAAGLEIGPRGGIITDDHMLTSDPDIYAVGDAVQVKDRVFGDGAMIPLAGPANKQGRIAADNIAGLDSRYEGTLGSGVVQVFDMTAAFTGANEKALIKRGLTRGKDYERLIICQLDHAGYFPGAQQMNIKLLFAQDGSRIFGAQIVGRGGVDKRLDVLATAIRLGASVRDLAQLELSYAPPYSSAKDPVNMAGFMAGNILDGKAEFSEWDVMEKHPLSQVVDVREDYEVAEFALPRAIHIPMGQLRERVDELDPGKETIVVCAWGTRAHNAARTLQNLGFRDVQIYPGGTGFYQMTHASTAPVAR